MKKKIILLVEDNPNDELLTRRAFEKNGIADALCVARDGVEALDFLGGTGSHAGRDARLLPALILLDLKLPKLSGLEVLKKLRANPLTHAIPVIILSSSDEYDDIFHSHRLGANSYLRKPVHFKEFMEIVAQVNLYWLQLNVSVNELEDNPGDKII